MNDETGNIYLLNGAAKDSPVGLDYPQEAQHFEFSQTKADEDEPLSPAAQTLYKAALLIDGDRNTQHGDRHVNFGTIATFWTVLFGIDIKPWQVARAIELAKIARDINGEPNPDNATDAAAYSALSWELRK